MIDDLAPARVEAELVRSGAMIGLPLSVVAETGSTNDDARAAAAAGAPHGATFVADAQRSGRGRAGHVWHSPPGDNLYVSIVARPRVSAVRIPAASLVIGLAVARAVDQLAPVVSSIKWPNDVLVAKRKIAGVLVEAQIRGGSVESLVIGLGLNVRGRAFPPELEGVATSLALLGAEVDRARALALLLKEIGLSLDAFEAGGLAPLLPELARRDALLGVPLRVGGVEGRGAGLDDAGRLLVQDRDARIHPVGSGSVELL